MSRRRGTRFEPQTQQLADTDIFLDDLAQADRPSGDRLSPTQAALQLSQGLTGGLGGGLYRYQTPGKHRRAIEQRYGNNQ